jgi:hypothetical protein
MEQKRPMHHGVVFVTLSGIQLPRVERVQTLIVALRPRAQVGKAGDDGQDAQENVEEHF